ncbi:hypothetical protein [Phyllobacterium sp. YR531]|uniref:hypothetical protein n=1 Tax=Phyllobacterium sp. YR531 TaxID=1144343 RepID=UPI00026F5B5B|nr:hypothetical protein [Phyllobacterium sp. YR531]EJN04479.1 hypothetical protein PMI41_02120 [Phyllobacterium sp. YR531]
MRIIICLVSLALMNTSAWSQSSKEYAQMAKRSWSAFECAALASTAELKEEHERLFKMGYDLGKIFIDAVKQNKVEGKDANSIVPWGFSFNMSGPSTDFALGVIWMTASDNSGKEVRIAQDGKPIDSGLWKNLAESKFRRTNCELL